MKTLLVTTLLVAVSLAQKNPFAPPFPIPDGQPRLSGAGYVTTDCKNLQLGEEPPFPFGYIDMINNYLYPNLRKLQSQRDVAGNYRRTFHTPLVGCLQGTFNVRNDLPADQRVGIFQAGASYPVYMRFSGQGQEFQNSTTGDVKGVALKFSNVPGKKMVPGFEDDHHMDIVFNAFPVFIPQNETAFAATIFSRVVLTGGGQVSASRFGTTFTANAAVAAMELANNSVASLLTMPFYAISPYKFGNGPLPRPAVKYRLWPCTYEPALGLPLPPGTPGDYLTETMRAQIANRSYCFDFQLQFQKDVCLHPINDFLTEWKESDTPFITVGRIDIPVQAMADNNDYTCRHVAYNAWRIPEEHRALGSLSRARLFDMLNSQNHRLSLDNAIEPVTQKYIQGVQYLAPDELGLNENFKGFRLKTDGIAYNN
jgi:catalase